MDKNTSIDIKELYKVLKKLDKDILSKFNDSSISDEDYFLYGIRSDLVSNCLNIIINQLINNVETPGIDISCRSIIEALVILKMNEANDISLEQKTIYRYLYTFVDLDNLKSYLKMNGEDEKVKKALEMMQKDEEKATEALTNHFNCTKEMLKVAGANDPCVYLKKRFNEDIRFSKLLKKYLVFNENSGKIYNFFSILLHPRCELDFEYQQKIADIRNNYIFQVLEQVDIYLRNNGLYDLEHCDFSFEKDYLENPKLKTNKTNLSLTEVAFNELENKICKFSNGWDAFSFLFYERFKSILIDMMISISLGYLEHTVSMFKTVIEEYSVFIDVNSICDIDEFKSVKKAYWCSSRLQLKDYYNDQKIGKENIEDILQEVYRNYFKEKYELNDYDTFRHEIERNSIYIVQNSKKNYSQLVNEALNKVFKDKDNEKNDIYLLYKISKDMNHASGYNFNASVGLVLGSARKTIYYTIRLLLYNILNHGLVLNEHSIKVEMDDIVSFFSNLASIYLESIEKN